MSDIQWVGAGIWGFVIAIMAALEWPLTRVQKWALAAIVVFAAFQIWLLGT